MLEINYESFLGDLWIVNLIKKEQEKIRWAYKYAEIASKNSFRKSWEPIFHHFFRTAKILVKEFWKKDSIKIVLALIHDIKEDTGTLDSTISVMFWEDVLYKLKILSKNDEDLSGKDKKEKVGNYFGRLLNCKDEDVILVKLADRIDNLRTMNVFRPEKIRRKILETEKYLLPLAKEYSPEAYILIVEEISKLRLGLSKKEHIKNLEKS